MAVFESVLVGIFFLDVIRNAGNTGIYSVQRIVVPPVGGEPFFNTKHHKSNIIQLKQWVVNPNSLVVNFLLGTVLGGGFFFYNLHRLII